MLFTSCFIFYNIFQHMTHTSKHMMQLGSFFNGPLFEQMIINPPKKTQLKKVNDWNVFPCFSCGGDPMLVDDCSRCDGKGHVKGNHPMVKMIEQIIDSKFKNKEQKIQLSSFENTLGTRLTDSSEGGEVHSEYNCDECGMDPIKGQRYHCPICKSYDVCQQCKKNSTHDHKLERAEVEQSQQPFSQIKPINKQTQKSLLFRMTLDSVTASKIPKSNSSL